MMGEFSVTPVGSAAAGAAFLTNDAPAANRSSTDKVAHHRKIVSVPAPGGAFRGLTA